MEMTKIDGSDSIELMLKHMQNMKSDFEGTYSPLLQMISDIHSQMELVKKEMSTLRSEVMKKDDIINDLKKTSNTNIIEVSDDIKKMKSEMDHLNDLVVFVSNQVNERVSLSSTISIDDSATEESNNSFGNIDDRFITMRKKKSSLSAEDDQDEKHLKHFCTLFLFVGSQLQRWNVAEQFREAKKKRQKQYLEEKLLNTAIAESLKEMVEKSRKVHDEKAISATIRESMMETPPTPQHTSKTNNGYPDKQNTEKKVDRSKNCEESTHCNLQHIGDWVKHSNDFAPHVMKKWGFQGGGLGKNGNGLKEPIETKKVSFKTDVDQNIVPPAWPKNTVLIAGSSMINQIDETRMSRKYNVKVRANNGATARDMVDHLNAYLRKKPDHLILHVGSNDASNENVTSDILYSRLLRLKSFAEYKVPGINVILSCPTVRSDNRRANAIIMDVRERLLENGYNIISNENITNVHLGKKGLHLSLHGVKRLAMNLIACIQGL